MIVYIEGSIGCGKSTTLEFINHAVQDKPHVKVVQEGLDDWLQVRDQSTNVLDHFYQDPDRHSFMFQMIILVHRQRAIRTLIQDMRAQFGNEFVLLVERSPASSDKVFRKCLPLKQIEHAAFDFIYNKLVTNEDLGVQTKFIYLDAPADTCLARIAQRGRPEERPITIQYLQQLELGYQELIRSTNATVIQSTQSTDAIVQQILALIL